MNFEVVELACKGECCTRSNEKSVCEHGERGTALMVATKFDGVKNAEQAYESLRSMTPVPFALGEEFARYESFAI